MPTPLSLVFDIAAVDRASAVFARVGSAATLAGTESETGLARVMAAGTKLAAGFAVATAAAAVLSVKMAADFQTSTNRLVTSAGEAAGALESDRKGLLEMAGQVGVSAVKLSEALYIVNSAGIRGGEGLTVLRAAAEGAAAEGAKVETVANALTTALNAYHLPASEATHVTDEFVAIVSNGKVRMEELAGAIAGVLPVAAVAHVSFAEVGGALATMTAQGTSADVATTYLKQTIGGLLNPTTKARNELLGLGISSMDLQKHLSERGLTGTIQVVSDAIKARLGPDGFAIVLDSLKKAGGQTDKFQASLTNLPPALQSTVGATASVVGGVKTMMGILELSGANMPTFVANVDKIAGAAKNTSKEVAGFELVQKSFNFQVDSLKASMGAWATEMGTKLLPVLTSIVEYLNKHPTVFKDVATAVAAIGAAFVVTRIAMMAYSIGATVVTGVVKAFTAVTWLMNAALSANPIGLVIVALAALAVGIIYAYNHSKTFRDIVDGAFRAVAAAAQFMWNDVIRPVFKFLVDVWLDTAGAIVHGAALAFGWVPGIGEKLHAAAAQFDRFRDDVNASLSGIQDQTVSILVTGAYGGLTNSPAAMLGMQLKAMGGPIVGPGTGTSDSIPAYVSNGEFIVRADGSNLGDAYAYFGRTLRRYAGGGGVDVQMQGSSGQITQLALGAVRDGAGHVVTDAKKAADAFTSSFGAAGAAGGAARWAPIVAMAAAMLGIPASVIPGVLAMINSESGGNPNAINLVDSNAAAGHPSRGLLQTIPSTFEAYRNPSLPDNIVDPLANIYAGMNYALNNYGLGMLMSGGRHTSGGGYLGYEMGTSYVPRDGLAYLHQGEGVLTKRENAAGRHGPTVNMSGQFFAYDPTQLAEAQEKKLRDAMALEGLSR